MSADEGGAGSPRSPEPEPVDVPPVAGERPDLEGPVQGSEDAKQRMLNWAEGRLSHNNLGHRLFSPTDAAERGQREQMIAVMDAQEVVKWAVVYTALFLTESEYERSVEGRG